MIAPARPAPVKAGPATGRDYLSYSQITSYQACPLRWFFHYVEDRPAEQVSADLVFGGAIHAAAEHHYRALLAGSPAPARDDLLRAYEPLLQGLLRRSFGEILCWCRVEPRH